MEEGDKTSFFIAFLIIVFIVLIGYWFLSSTPQIPPAAPTPASQQVQPPPGTSGSVTPPPMANPTTLQITTLREGSGEGAKNGDKVTVNYTGMFTDGKVFDSSIPRGQPFQFMLGAGQVIPGWDKGLLGMKAGEKRKLVIPSDLAYGARGAGNGAIPPNATLVFEVEMLKIN